MPEHSFPSPFTCTPNHLSKHEIQLLSNMYPTHHIQIQNLFTLLHSDREAFFSHVSLNLHILEPTRSCFFPPTHSDLLRISPNVAWTIMGTHHLAGHYTSRDQVQSKVWNRLDRAMKPPGIKMTVRNVVIGRGDSPWCAVEMVGKGSGINGFNFENCHAWCCRFDEHGMIVEVRSYLDSAMVRDALVLLDRFGEEYEANKRAEVPDFKESTC
ncbi:hypothetical protein AC579_9015 [Pseudocercospora musae]|uniref:SnoaL-like domain-containing protein n=1 Tax=Pseudocercospora musae TaxID=113226 RepID=A0A139ISZ7_9PEZI|nr:hypothetical protein AC579_9015 [Pseudocercospora musae]